MKKCMAVLLLVLPLATLAAGFESTPQINVQEQDFAVGKKAVKEQDWQAAVNAFNRVVKDDPQNADAHNYLGYSYRNLNRMEQSFQHYREALRLNPNHRGANEYIGQAYLKTNQPEKAEEHLLRLEKICGKTCEEYEDLDKSIAAYRKRNPS